MKKWILLVVACALTLSACGKNEVENEKIDEFQPPLTELCWGMTSNEITSFYPLQEEDTLTDNGGIVMLYYEKEEAFGEEAEIELVCEQQYGFGLNRMRIYFNQLSKESEAALREKINLLYGDCSAVNESGEPCEWKSSKILDTSEKLQQRFRYVKVEYAAGKMKETAMDFSEETMWNNLSEQALVCVSFKNGILEYNAENMAAAMCFENDVRYKEILSSLP